MPIAGAGRRPHATREVRRMTSASSPSSSSLPAEALHLLRRLGEQHVEHVLIGDLAAVLHGCPAGDRTTVIVPARFARNLTRLSRVLRSVHARGRGPSVAGASAPTLTPEGLRALGHWRLSSDHGPLDIDFEPPATAGHLDLFENARRMLLADDLEVEVAAIADLVRIAEMRRGPRDEALLQGLREALASGATPR
jgi:hypothetical protein